MIDQTPAYEQVMNEYVASVETGHPSYDHMVKWCQKYPQFSHDIAEFTIAWVMSELPTMEINLQKAAENLKDAERSDRIGLQVAQSVYQHMNRNPEIR